MAQVVVTIAGRTYRMSCEDGQEPHLERLAQEVDARMVDMRQSFGEIGDQRLVVMTALTIADELDTARTRIAALEAQEQTLKGDLETAAAAAQARVDAFEAVIQTTAERVERVAAALGGGKP